MQSSPPSLLPFEAAHLKAIPRALQLSPRWAPWRAEWNVKRKKFEKIPVRADDPRLGLSTDNPERWFAFKGATAAVRRSPGALAGVGYVLTGPHGIVGIDLDRAVVDGELLPWAQEIAHRMNSYAEISPSGKGVRIFVGGSIDADWTCHPKGVEAYGGSTARFLTVTGRHITGTPTDVEPAPPGALEWLAETYRESDLSAADAGDVPPMPELLAEEALPQLADLSLPPRAVAFLADGDAGEDRSRTLYSTAVALFAAGLDEQQVFSLLALNAHAMEIAMDHRRQDEENARNYVWQHHVCKAKAKAASKVLQPGDWVIEDELAEPVNEADAETPVASGETDSRQAPPAAGKLTFRVESADAFAAGGASLPAYVQGVMTEAEIGSLFGQSGTGKTMIATDILACVALGRPWRGRRVRQARVLYACLEGQSGMRGRIKAYRQRHGVTFGDALEVLTGPVDLHKAGGEAPLIELLQRRGPRGILVLDTLARATPGADEVGSRDMGPVLQRCRVIHLATGWLVLLIAHAGKDESRGIRGWSGIKGALDFELEVSRRGDSRYLTVTKMKDGRGEGDVYAFSVESVPIGQDEDGTEITAGVAVECAAPPPAAAIGKAKGANQLLILSVLADLSAAGNTRPTKQEVITAAGAQLSPGSGARTNTQSQRARAALAALIDDGTVETDGVRCWIDQSAPADLSVED